MPYRAVPGMSPCHARPGQPVAHLYLGDKVRVGSDIARVGAAQDLGWYDHGIRGDVLAYPQRSRFIYISSKT
jgi:hypothetical protein